MLAGGTGRAATRGGGPVIELECGITIYPAREEQGRWRAVWHENGERQQCEAASEEKLAAKLEKVTERLEADAPNMTLRGADLIAFYLSPDRLPVQRQWSRKHAHTQRRLCERFAAPVIGAVICQDITTGHMQKIVNAAATPGEGGRVRGMISALVTVGLEGGYLASSRLAKVHWQAGERPMPLPRASVAGESVLWVDPAEVPADADAAGLGRALAAGRHGDRDELMAVIAAYSGLRWGELAALTIAQVDPAARVISVDRKVVEVAGHLYVEAPKNRKCRRTIYPRRTPAGYPLAERLAARLGSYGCNAQAGRFCIFRPVARATGVGSSCASPRLSPGRLAVLHTYPGRDRTMPAGVARVRAISTKSRTPRPGPAPSDSGHGGLTRWAST